VTDRPVHRVPLAVERAVYVSEHRKHFWVGVIFWGAIILGLGAFVVASWV